MSFFYDILTLRQKRAAIVIAIANAVNIVLQVLINYPMMRFVIMKKNKTAKCYCQYPMLGVMIILLRNRIILINSVAVRNDFPAGQRMLSMLLTAYMTIMTIYGLKYLQDKKEGVIERAAVLLLILGGTFAAAGNMPFILQRVSIISSMRWLMKML